MISQKLRDSARGQQCTLQLPGVCNGDRETTVLAHLRSSIGLKGMAAKVPDYWACFACSACHEKLDNDRVVWIDAWIMPALEKTWARWFEMGLLRVAEPRTPNEPRPKKLTKPALPIKTLFKRIRGV